MNHLDLNKPLLIPRKIDIFLCCVIVFSFCYELPLLKITSFDRFNPRLFDIAVLVAVFVTRWRRNRKDKVLHAWEYLTLAFIFACIMSVIFVLPMRYRLFSMYFAFKYIEGLIALWILSGFAWKKEHVELLLKVFCCGVIMAGIVGLLQFFGLLQVKRILPTGVEIITQKNIILSTLGPTYFHAGIIGAFGACIALALRMKKAMGYIFFSISFVSGLFLALFSGCRASVGVVAIGLGCLIIVRMRFLILFIAVVFVILSTTNIADIIQTKSSTIARFKVTGPNSVSERATIDWRNSGIIYWKEFGLQILEFGGGFYCVPINGYYRVGYGIHNIHLFPLEQAGLLGFLAAIYFWYIILFVGFKQNMDIYSRCGLSLAIGMIIIGWTGQIFYYGFGTEDMVICQVFAIQSLLFMSSIKNKDQLNTSNSKKTIANEKNYIHKVYKSNPFPLL